MFDSFSVYKHVNKVNGKIYIGITSQNVKRRWQNGAGYYGTYFYNAIKKYGWDNFTHEVITDGLSQTEAENMEIALIKQFQSNCRDKGYNIAKGGKVVHGCNDRIGRKNHKSQKINVYDKAHNFICSFESQNLAAKHLGINRKGITKNCRGISKTYKGYIFEYAEQNFIKPSKCAVGKHPNHRKTKVNLLDNEGNVIETFNSYLEAAEKYDCNANGIAKCCNGYLKSYHGRRWCRAVF